MATKTARIDAVRHMNAARWMLLVLTALAVVATACSAAAKAPDVSQEDREPFSARRESADGAIVEWSGFVEGYEPGAEETFELSIKNETGENWPGRFCLQLMDNDGPRVLATLEQRPFNLEPGMGFSDTITVQLPEDLEPGAYALSMVVRGPDGPTVDMVPVEVGETDQERGTTTQEHMDAALEACPEVSGPRSEAQNLITLAKEDLAGRVGAGFDEIVVQDVREAEFPDASLGVPEQGKAYAQVITPGYVIQLKADGKVYEYHGAGERVVLAVEGVEGSSDS